MDEWIMCSVWRAVLLKNLFLDVSVCRVLDSLVMTVVMIDHRKSLGLGDHVSESFY